MIESLLSRGPACRRGAPGGRPLATCHGFVERLSIHNLQIFNQPSIVNDAIDHRQFRRPTSRHCMTGDAQIHPAGPASTARSPASPARGQPGESWDMNAGKAARDIPRLVARRSIHPAQPMGTERVRVLRTGRRQQKCRPPNSAPSNQVQSIPPRAAHPPAP